MSSISISKKSAYATPVVLVDGRDVTNQLRGVDVNLRPNQPTRVTLDLHIPDVIEIQDEHPRILITDDLAVTLVALGWTAPEVQA